VERVFATDGMRGFLSGSRPYPPAELQHTRDDRTRICPPTYPRPCSHSWADSPVVTIAACHEVIGSNTPRVVGAPPRRRLAIRWTCVVVLLGVYAAVTFAVATRKGLSFDESEEMAVGYNIWRRHDFRMEAANGDLIKRWATLPFLVSRPKLPSTDQWYWQQGGAYELGYAFCFNEGNNVDSLLRQARVMTIALGVATGLVVFLLARALFGTAGGLTSLGLFTFSPHMLAFGAIVSTEMSICLTLLAATWCAWRLLHRVTAGRVATGLACTGLLVLAKLTALTVLPIVVVLVAVKLSSRRALVWEIGRPKIITSKWRQGAIFAALFVAHAAAAWASIWTQYEFRYAASPRPNDPTITIARLRHPDPVSPMAVSFIDWSHRSHFLPEGFLEGVSRLLEHNDNRVTFLDGQWKIGGWRHFFPRTLWLKSSPIFMLLLVFAGGVWWHTRRRQVSSAADEEGVLSPSFYEATPYVAIVVIVVAAGVAQNLNIGHRHVLPIYPPLYILAGAIGLCRRRATRKAFIVAAILIGAVAVESASVFPSYLAYFNPLVGGTAQGYHHLVDSSVDWGMGLPELKQWLDEHNPAGREPVFLAYFGTDSPANRHIDCHQLPSFFDWRQPQPMYALGPGIYAISATLLQSVYTDPLGPWCTIAENRYQSILRDFARYEAAMRDPEIRAAFLHQYPADAWTREYGALEKLRFGRLCAWLRHHGPPGATIAGGILVWRLDERDVRAALFGPPAEIDDSFVREIMSRR
jgi:hypothetical protein